MINMKIFFLASLILALSILTGCTVLDYKSTKTETVTPATESVDKQLQSELKAKVIELEQRIKVLEEKLQGQW
ncbi:MAG: hypothetical protein IH836_08440 [Proteobacteria bacterium]|nr:hypothetical protein [Pseudomonadota bacterium]MCH8976208.1 hypothetical protein [Pseudomonadota bacterium]MCH9048947.1 hypothetical protein [Pseudomonadota bacterium]